MQVADILGKATESVPKEEVRESNPHLKNLYEGLTMTEAQLQKVNFIQTFPCYGFMEYFDVTFTTIRNTDRVTTLMSWS
jgi:hypothetical protein